MQHAANHASWADGLEKIHTSHLLDAASIPALEGSARQWLQQNTVRLSALQGPPPMHAPLSLAALVWPST